ncbi:MAG: phosphoribosylanthranilate isomerase [Terracidiphilus sp.]
MSLWIKICGNTSLADAQHAAEAGADAVGFVLAPSPRQVSPEKIAEIVAQLPTRLEKIGVFVGASFGEITSAVETCGLTGVQLHWDAPRDLPMKLRMRLGPKVRILRVMYSDGGGATAALAPESASSVDAILVDSHTTYASGGTGLAFDWSDASKTLFQNPAVRRNLIAAGGLTPLNIATAINTLHPWGVDVVSGVESAPGRKDPVKVRTFVANARAAAK